MKPPQLRHWIIVVDLAWALTALAAAIVLRYGAETALGQAAHFLRYVPIAGITALGWTLLYFELNLDGFDGGWNLVTIVSRIGVAVFLLMALDLAFGFLTRQYYSRLALLYFASLLFFGLVGLRCLARALVVSEALSSRASRCVILGDGPVAQELAKKITLHPEMEFNLVGFLCPCEADAFNLAGGRIAGSLTSLSTLQVVDVLKQNKIQQIIVTTPQSHQAGFQKLIHVCQEAAMRVYLVPQGYGLYLSRAELLDIDGLPLLSLREPNPSAVGLKLKRGVDCVLSLCALALLGPLIATIAIVVYKRRGKAFCSEIRCGQHGVPFKMYRLNIARHPSNPRFLDRFALRWSLTELPQLWNVLRGDMSLVGPRPEAFDRVKYYSEWQHKRLGVPAGVTGLAQVNGLRDKHSSEEKTHFDLQYILRWSPVLDVTLIVQTLWVLLTRGLESRQIQSPRIDLQANSHDLRAQEVADANRT